MSSLRLLLPLALLAGCPTTDDTDGVDDTDAVDTDDSDVADTDDTDVADSDVDDTDTDTDAGPTWHEATFDASSHTDPVFVDLATGQAVDPASAGSPDWQLWLRRSVIRTNGGDSGTGDVAVALVDAQDDFYDLEGAPVAATFTAATPDGELDHLLADVAEPATWSADAIDPVLGEDWYVYDFANGDITENDANGFLILGGEGSSYARMRVTDLDFPTRTGAGITAFTIALEVQGSGETAFDTTPVAFSGSIGSAGGELCYDMDTAATVACTGTAWDLRLGYVGRSFFLYTNGGDAGEGLGGAQGPFDWSTLAGWTRGDQDDQGADITGDYAVETSTSRIAEEGWYAYGLQGGHRLWPNHRVWLVDADATDADSPTWAVQVSDYYDGSGTSGHVTLRWRALRADEPVAAP